MAEVHGRDDDDDLGRRNRRTRPAQDTFDDAKLAAAMDRWNEQVKRDIPAQRLLVWEPKDGWEPLCEFLEVPVPSEPLPNSNDTLAFKEGITGGAIAAVNAWWEARERPSAGLHGAALEEEPVA